MYRRSLFTLLAIAITSLFSFGQEKKSAHLSAVLQQLHLSTKDCYQDLVVEKVLPYAKTQSVLVIPKIAQQEEGWVSLDSYILVIDTQTGKILQTYYEPEAWESDAVRLEEIIIDTAPYKVNDSNRAFGIRVRHHGSSGPNPFSEETLSLFIPQGKQLVKILDNFIVATYRGEWDMNCAGEFEEEKKTLIISPTQTNAFFDLISKNQITTTSQTPKGEDCLEKTRQETTTQTLRFTGDKYK